jgi:metal-responsive CopG/Arc/MetJ family transcriptional regulator
MATLERVTITLPVELLEDIDRREKNRSKFVVEAVRGELERRRRAELRRSLQNPHSESVEFTDREIEEWALSLPEETEALVDSSSGTPVRWLPGEGWIAESE